ncbi:MAG: PIN domain-containing protein [Nevskia sp.]|nr:PIN domain-containing protein [Nevskia sp.]
MILADSGFWYALSASRDRYHKAAVRAAQKYAAETLVSTWPVINEVCYLIGDRSGSSKVIEFLEHAAAGACSIMEVPPVSIVRMHRLMKKYADLPMDLADASLVVLAEELGEGRILSTDERDFRAYRWKNTKPFKNLLLTDG